MRKVLGWAFGAGLPGLIGVITVYRFLSEPNQELTGYLEFGPYVSPLLGKELTAVRTLANDRALDQLSSELPDLFPTEIDDPELRRIDREARDRSKQIWEARTNKLAELRTAVSSLEWAARSPDHNFYLLKIENTGRKSLENVEATLPDSSTVLARLRGQDDYSRVQGDIVVVGDLPAKAFVTVAFWSAADVSYVSDRIHLAHKDNEGSIEVVQSYMTFWGTFRATLWRNLLIFFCLAQLLHFFRPRPSQLGAPSSSTAADPDPPHAKPLP